MAYLLIRVHSHRWRDLSVYCTVTSKYFTWR